MPTKTMIRNGKLIEVDEQVLLWRRKMKTFKENKTILYGYLLLRLESIEKVEAWFNTPQEALGSAPPKQFLNPKQIKGLISYAKKTVKAKL